MSTSSPFFFEEVLSPYFFSVVQLAVEMDAPKLIVELDSKGVVSMVNDTNLSAVGPSLKRSKGC